MMNRLKVALLLPVYFALLLQGCGGTDLPYGATVQACKEVGKICICHFPPGNPENVQNICVAESSWKAHEAHGDYVGECTCEDLGNCPPEVEPDAGVAEDGGFVQDGGEPEPEQDGGITENPDAGTETEPDADLPVLDSGSPGDNPDTPSGPVTPPSRNVPTPPAEQPSDYYAVAGGCNVHGYANTAFNWTGTIVCFGIFVCFLVASWIWPNRRWLYWMLLIAFSLCTTGLVYAFPTQNFAPAVASHDYWITKDARISLPNVGLLYGFEHRPVRLIQKPGNGTVTDIIDSRHMLHVYGAYGFLDRMEIGVDIPIVLHQEAGNLAPVGLTDLPGGIGDLRLLLKTRLYTYKSLNVGLGVTFGFPTASAGLAGSDSTSAQIEGLVSGKVGPVELAGNAGIVLQNNDNISGINLQQLDTGHTFTGSLAARWKFYDDDSLSLAVVSDAFIRTTIDSIQEEEVPLEWINGLSLGFGNGWQARAGVGAGFTRGVGLPVVRVLAGLSWSYDWTKKCSQVVVRPNIQIVKTPYFEKPVEVVKEVVMPKINPVFFAFDSANLSLEAQATILENLRSLRLYRRLGVKIQRITLVGAADKRGTDDYNIKLGMRRAKAVERFIEVPSRLEKNGLTAEQIDVISVGETKASQSANTELEHQTHRFVDFSFEVE